MRAIENTHSNRDRTSPQMNSLQGGCSHRRAEEEEKEEEVEKNEEKEEEAKEENEE
jgi:hypothetical protein